MTDDDAVAPDAIVRTALQLLPVPPHGDGFWATLEASLDAEGAPRPAGADRPLTAVAPTGAASADTPEPTDATDTTDPTGVRVVELVPDQRLALVPPGVRRRSNVVLSAVAVAAAIVVVVAGTTLVRDRADSGTDTDTAAASDTTDDTSEAVLSSTSSSLPALTTGAESVPADAVLAWVEALGQGDTHTAWTAMGPASQAHFGAESAFADQASSLAEGYGAWSAATPDDILVTSLVASGDGEVVVVTLVGTVEQEGTRQHRADAFPVRVVHGVASLEPFAFAGELEIVVPEDVPAGGTRPLVHGDDELVVVVPRGVEAPTIRLDDGDTLVCGEAEGTELTELDGAPGQRCTYHPEGGIDPGDRVLTVAFLSPDGTGISAESVLFEAA
jgi:hypothetical protein